jgi:hypothetical protein
MPISMRRSGDKRIEALLLLAKSGRRGGRRQSLAGILITVGVVLAITCGLVWWFRPRVVLPELLLAAYDQIALPGEKTAIRAQIEPHRQPPAGLDLAGCDLYFQEQRTARLLGKVATDAFGIAALESAFEAANPPGQVVVRYRGDATGHRGSEARQQVFVWAPDSLLLLVDADHGLAEGNEASLWSKNNLDIRPQDGALQALQAAAAQHYRVAYLSASADRPSRYNKLRAWLDRGWVPAAERFPPGPLLALAGTAHNKDGKAFRERIVADLKSRFSKKIHALTQDSECARDLDRGGLQTALLGKDVPAAGVKGFRDWTEWGRQFKQ